MEKVDLVLVGAEGVVESGGIINKVSQVWPRISLVCRVIITVKSNVHVPCLAAGPHNLSCKALVSTSTLVPQ